MVCRLDLACGPHYVTLGAAPWTELTQTGPMGRAQDTHLMWHPFQLAQNLDQLEQVPCVAQSLTSHWQCYVQRCAYSSQSGICATCSTCPSCLGMHKEGVWDPVARWLCPACGLPLDHLWGAKWVWHPWVSEYNVEPKKQRVNQKKNVAWTLTLK